jgi:opacity protein-like surface antigen
MEKKLLKSALGIVAVASAGVLSAGESSLRPYVSVGGGGEKISKRSDTKYKAGAVGNIALGVSYDSWRLELEIAYRHSKIKTTKIGNTEYTKGMKYKSLAGMVNVYYDYSLTDNVFVYLGVGVGIASVKTAFGHDTFPAGGIYTDSKFELSKTVFAWQVMAGLGYNFTDNITGSAGYHLFGTSKQKYGRIRLVNAGNVIEYKRKAPLQHGVEGKIAYHF